MTLTVYVPESAVWAATLILSNPVELSTVTLPAVAPAGIAVIVNESTPVPPETVADDSVWVMPTFVARVA